MKVCKALILLSLFMVAFYNCAPPPDEDTKEETGEDTTTAELPWTGETDKFTINTKEGVHLNDPEEDAGTAYITFPSSSVHNTRWEFGVRLTFNPSANNYARFYLRQRKRLLYPNRRSQRQRGTLPAERGRIKTVSFRQRAYEGEQLT